MKLSEGPRYNSTRITTATTTVVKSGTGTLHGFFINVAVAATITFNDAIGTKWVLPASFPVGCYVGIDAGFAGKIEVVTAGASDITILWL